jgi:hypothetical protein
VKIGILVDGQAEFQGLRHLLSRLGSPHQILSPLYCDIQPLASPAQMALAASKKFQVLLVKGVEAIVVLIDKETRQECTGDLVRQIEREARARLSDLAPEVHLRVVLKVTKLENWLVADPGALRDVPGLIENPERIEKQVSRGRADAVDALGLLKGCWRKRSFNKPECAIAICQKIDPARAAANSRSFRKLLKTLGHPDYDEPAPPSPTGARRTRKPKGRS